MATHPLGDAAVSDELGILANVCWSAVARVPSGFAARTTLKAFAMASGPLGHPALPTDADERQRVALRLLDGFAVAVARALSWRRREVTLSHKLPQTLAHVLAVLGLEREAGAVAYAEALNHALHRKLRACDDATERSMMCRTALEPLEPADDFLWVPGTDFITLHLGILKQHCALQPHLVQGLLDAMVHEPDPAVSIDAFVARLTEAAMEARIQAEKSAPYDSASQVKSAPQLRRLRSL